MRLKTSFRTTKSNSSHRLIAPLHNYSRNQVLTAIESGSGLRSSHSASCHQLIQVQATLKSSSIFLFEKTSYCCFAFKMAVINADNGYGSVEYLFYHVLGLAI